MRRGFGPQGFRLQEEMRSLAPGDLVVERERSVFWPEA
jgi:hypothetical protein